MAVLGLAQRTCAPPPRAAVFGRRQACLKRAAPVLMAFKNSGEQMVSSDAEAAAPAATGAQQVSPAALSSYDEREFGGYEGGSMPQLAGGEMSEEEEEQVQQAEAAQRNADYLEQLRALGGDALAEQEARKAKISCLEVLESVDGMVGNYEEQAGSNGEKANADPQDHADDLQRILAELEQLEAAARKKRSDASTEPVEGVGMEELK